MWALISRRFDGWVSAKCCLAAVAGPPHRWRPHPSNPLMRRRASLAMDEREYKADGTSRDRPHCHWRAMNETTFKFGARNRVATRPAGFIQGNISTLRQRWLPSWPHPQDIISHTQTPAAPGAAGTAFRLG